MRLTDDSSHKASKATPSPSYSVQVGEQEHRRRNELTNSRVLDAPNLKDDFYCSPLAYSATTHTLVVCLGNLLYAWSEFRGVQLLHGTPPGT